MPDLAMTPEALVFGATGCVLLYLGAHLLTVRPSSTATRTLGLLVLAGAVTSLARMVWKSALEPTPAPFVSAVAGDMVVFLQVLFAYHCVVDDRPRERRWATGICGVVIGLNVLHSLVLLQRDTDFYAPLEFLCRRLESDPAVRARLQPFLWWTGRATPMALYGWALLVLLRKCARLEAAAGGHPWRGLLRPRSRDGRAAQEFALLLLCLLLVPLTSALGVRLNDPVLLLFATCAAVWVHINHSPEPTRLRFKLVSIPMAGVVGMLAMMLSWVLDAQVADLEDGRVATAERLRARMAAAPGGDPAAVRLDDGDPGPGVAFVVSRAAAEGSFPRALATHWAAPGVDTGTVLESLRREESWWRRSDTWETARRNPGLTPEEVAARVDGRFAKGELRPFFGDGTWAFHGSLLPGDARWWVRRWEGDGRVYEAGWRESERRAAIHGRVLPLFLVILATGAFLVVGLPLLYRNSVLAPIDTLVVGVRRVEAGDMETPSGVTGNDEFGTLGRAFDAMVASVRESRLALERINRAAFRFVPRPFLRQLGHESILDAELGQNRRARMTVLFADIRGFTTLSESMTPEETFTFVNDFLRGVGPIVRRHGGFIDKYMGDAVMALFPGSGADAVAAAVEMRGDLLRFNADRAARGLEPIRVGAGLHTGELTLGIIGEDERLDVTVIADVVNTASRLEGLTKRYGAAILMSAETRADLAAPETVPHRFVEAVQVKGRAAAVEVYELFGEDVPASDLALLMDTRDELERGWRDYAAGRFDGAVERLRAVARRLPDDPVVRLHLASAGERAGTEPPPGWTGVHRMDSK